MKTQLQVFARLKPSQTNPITYDIDRQRKTLIIGQKHSKSGYINNMKETIEFNMTDVIDSGASQEEVFELVAVPVVLNCLDGYNGTIFAYGQTGSGKTYTINGSDLWDDRGIIPRVMSYVFEQIDERNNEFEYKVYASYMEIYNEKAYDLLNEDHLVSPIDQWNKIEFKRDHQGNIHLNNISLHEIDDARPGMDLLMMGNYIRKQASTPMNQYSSRSHCIFTLTFEAKQISTGTCLVSKLNLVDLAGSERVSKTNHDGNLLNEAKNINLSLSYLEQVIVALNEKKKTGLRQHIPYRHSILTTILKDSLGGNCKTVMIANVSTEMDNFEETISALRFSQRVGDLENEIHRNEKMNLNDKVEKLEQEKQTLLEELEKYQRIVGDIKDVENRKSENQHKLTNSRQQQEDTFEDGEDADINDLLTKVDDYMIEKTSHLDVRNMVEAKLVFRAMKEYHKTTMAEYLRELSDISKKLKQYDALLSIPKNMPQDNLQQKQYSQKNSQTKSDKQLNQNRDSEITQMALSNFYNGKNQLNKEYVGHQPSPDENIDPDKSVRSESSQSSKFEYRPIYYSPISQNIPISEMLGAEQNHNKKQKQQAQMQTPYDSIEVNLYNQKQQQQQQIKTIEPLSRSKNQNTFLQGYQQPSQLIKSKSQAKHIQNNYQDDLH